MIYKKHGQSLSAFSFGLVEYLLVVEHELPAVALSLPVQSLSTAIQNYSVPFVQAHVPPVEVCTEGVSSIVAPGALISVNH